jgi:hypothetical protein
VLATLIPGFFLPACSEQPQESVAEAPDKSTAAAPQAAPAVEKGLFFQPELTGFTLHNEYDDDGDGDGINETHVRRYINSKGDTAFSMTTGDRLWAWSLDPKDGDDTDIRNNHVVRDSNCDGVFDERYSLDAEFHVPACLAQEGSAKKPEGV